MINLNKLYKKHKRIMIILIILVAIIVSTVSNRGEKLATKDLESFTNHLDRKVPTRPVKKPGSTFLYSNPGYGLLELLIVYFYKATLAVKVWS